ncbi:hypothetical protein CQ010_18195 [Arthrobacter sp. MYb211]|uniref:hypothetical protein n=1 Tax=unclassified Arthrobacter TaxID=235627 RepID=UPI000CFC4F26|nr:MULTISPECIES: hypothetical protein [unclassified Arthrobacter]PRA08207.1 hypothetical protein CQ015_18175 [Arthrobacter sp. MYb221]PRC02740.1 hypothetical protein CQ010_18195 [Arthrobacter sp. MYb211]
MKLQSSAVSVALLLLLTACSGEGNTAEPLASNKVEEEVVESAPVNMTWEERYEAKLDAAEQVQKLSLTEPRTDESYADLRTTTSAAIDHSSLNGLLTTWVNNAVAKGDCEAWNEAFHPEVRVADCTTNEALLIEDMALSGIQYEDVVETLDVWTITGSLAGTSTTTQFGIPEPQNIQGKWYFVEPLSSAFVSKRLEQDRTFADEETGNISPYSEEGFNQQVRPNAEPSSSPPSEEPSGINLEAVIDHSSKEKFLESWTEYALIAADCDAWNEALSSDLNPVDCTGPSARTFEKLHGAELTEYVSYSEYGDGITSLLVKIAGSSEPVKFYLYDITDVDGGWSFTAHPNLENIGNQAMDTRDYIDSNQT